MAREPVAPAKPKPRPVGRPRDEEKRQAILAAGWTIFLSEGVDAASLDAIARKAGVSRVTLYSHFPDKTALFEATIRREMEGLEATQKKPFESGLPLRAGLIVFGAGLMTYLTSLTVISFYSVLAGDLRRHPDLARRFYDLGPGVTHKNLTAILQRAKEQGELTMSSPAEAAEHLIGLWQGISNYKLSLGVETEELVATIGRRVERAVDVFLAAYGLTIRDAPERNA